MYRLFLFSVGPIALPPELIESGPQFLEVEFPGLPGINELSLESYTIQHKHTNDNNKLNETEKIRTSARPLKKIFRDLEYNTSYSFRYKVEDNDGESDYSAWVVYATKARGNEIPISSVHLNTPFSSQILIPRRSVDNVFAHFFKAKHNASLTGFF